MEENTPVTPTEKKTSLMTPIAIVIAGVLIAGAVFYTNSGAPVNEPVNQEQELGTIPTLQEDDYVLGDRNADILLVEYSDLECPFCKAFHATAAQIVEEYDGEVAWVYRHFPLSQIHPNAPALAEAAECAGELGGNDTFWAFIDGIFERAPGNTLFPIDQLSALATEVGVDSSDFAECIESERHRQKIIDQFNDAITAGGQGTPFSVLLVQDDEDTQLPIEGAQPVEIIRAAVDGLLK